MSDHTPTPQPVDDELAPLVLDGQDDHGDPDALLAAHRDEIFSTQESDPQEGQA